MPGSDDTRRIGPRLREVGSEVFHYLGDPPSEFTQNMDGDTWLTKGYVQRRFALHIHLRIGALGVPESHEFCALVQRAMSRNDLNRTNTRNVRKNGSYLSTFLPDAERGVQETMLVSVRQPSDPVKRDAHPLVCVRSLVWLDFLNECPVFRANTAEHFTQPFAAWDFFGIDRELVSLSRSFSVQDHELAKQIVEGGSQVVDYFAGNDSPTGIRPFDDLLNPDDPPLALSVELLGDAERITCDVCPPLRLEAIQMCLGAFEAELGAEQ